MEIKVPKEIKLLTHTYKISFDKKELDSTGTCGLTKHLYQKIYLDKQSLPPSELNQVFLHELIHVIERHFCVRLEDADVERLSQGLAEILFNSLGIELSWDEVNRE